MEKQRGNEVNGAIVAILVEAGEAGRISDWAADNWSVAVAEHKKPGGMDVLLEIYFENSLEAELAARAVRQFPIRDCSVREYRAEEWTESWKRHFHAVDIGTRLRVVPPWLAGQAPVGDPRAEVVINPGLSFGTGNHFTTRFCLEQLDRLVPESGRGTFLDIGTGSGILAIAAVKLGAKQATGTDMDPVCVQQAGENSALNGVADRTRFMLHDITSGWHGEAFDLACANIYASLLIDQASTLLRAARKTLIVTGIREMEVDGVAEAFVRLGGRERVRDSDHEWAGLVIEK